VGGVKKHEGVGGDAHHGIAGVNLAGDQSEQAETSAPEDEDDNERDDPATIGTTTTTTASARLEPHRDGHRVGGQTTASSGTKRRLSASGDFPAGLVAKRDDKAEFTEVMK